MAAALLACDWGTTNLRAWTLDAAGTILAQRDFELGVSRLSPGEAERRFTNEVRPALGASDLPAILCGMIGSNLGWALAPYAPCPAGLTALAHNVLRVAPRTVIIPGLINAGITDAPDVMRGEETQVLGWIAQAAERARGCHLICHPGTHAKWVFVEDGQIRRFITAMTGELFSVLRKHSVLKHDGPVDDNTAFDAGVRAAGRGDALAARLFSARARVVGSDAPQASTPSYLSGLLIGSEIAALLPLLAPRPIPVTLIGDETLCHWYARALSAQGAVVTAYDGVEAAVSGLTALARLEGLI